MNAKMRHLVIIHVNPRRLCNKWALKVEDEKIRAALKVTAGYIPAATVLYINNQTTKDEFKITLCSSLKDLWSFIKKQREFNSYSEDCCFFYIKLFNFSSRLLAE